MNIQTYLDDNDQSAINSFWTSLFPENLTFHTYSKKNIES